MTVNDLKQPKIAIIGLGYVGLPLALAFSNHFHVVGFDINDSRIRDLRNGIDKTGEISDTDIQCLGKISFTSEASAIKECNIYIVTVPTPINNILEPDLNPLIGASMSVGSVLSRGNLVIYKCVFLGPLKRFVYPYSKKNQDL